MISFGETIYKMKHVLFLFALSIGLISCSARNEKPITELSQNDIENGTLIDVRTPEEYNAGYIDKAININWFDRDFKKQIEKIDKNKTVYLYCKMGGRSAKAAIILIDKEYEVVDLIGGYETWIRE